MFSNFRWDLRPKFWTPEILRNHQKALPRAAFGAKMDPQNPVGNNPPPIAKRDFQIFAGTCGPILDPGNPQNHQKPLARATFGGFLVPSGINPPLLSKRDFQIFWPQFHLDGGVLLTTVVIGGLGDWGFGDWGIGTHTPFNICLCKNKKNVAGGRSFYFGWGALWYASPFLG